MPYLQIMVLLQLTDKDVELPGQICIATESNRKIHIQLKFLIYLQLLQGLVHLIYVLLAMYNAGMKKVVW